tara:strand:+ start:134 stop:274 length:141 start_codon:yes stop_codon:yes gene_type:complete
MFELLKLGKFYGASENIEIAKGKNEIPLTLKKGLKQLKRLREWKKI